MSDWDSLDVSLYDGELREEVDLTTRLIVAVNEAGRALSVEEIDEILGLPAAREPG